MLIKAGAKGFIPIGARLTYDGFNKLYQVGTETYNGRPVHPMTMDVSKEALEIIKKNPEQIYILSNFYIAVSDDAKYRTSFEGDLYMKVNEHRYVADLFPEDIKDTKYHEKLAEERDKDIENYPNDLYLKSVTI